jgi:hypothetical protein
MEIAMASKFATVKLNTQLVDEARREAEVFLRSLGGQIEHRAQFGRALENAEGVSASRVRAALEGRLKLDDLSEAEQDAVFDGLGQVFASPGPDVVSAFAALGEKRRSARAARQTGTDRSAAKRKA